MRVTLDGLYHIPRPGWEGAPSLDNFLAHPLVRTLEWPVAVVEQFLYEHGRYGPFRTDYGHVNLFDVRWSLEYLGAEQLARMPTGPSEDGLLEEVAANHAHCLSTRPEAKVAWDLRGTWIVPPVLLSRALLVPPSGGLQVVEGRTRVGILRGRLADDLHVASRHEVWIGR